MAEVIECTPVDLSDEQRANLAKLAAYLWTLPANYPDFEMSEFVQNGGGPSSRFAHVACGTAACAVGHGPKAGVGPEEGETWFRYSYRAFINWGESTTHSFAWEWCFGGDWSSTDNTVHGAAARIEYLLEHGMPDNASEQEEGVAPLCYTTERAA